MPGAPPRPTPSRLASGLAHELANSLTTVHGYAHLIDRSVLNAADRSALEHITTSSEKMLTTVEAFRALVRPLPISATTFAPVDAVRAAIALARQEAELPDAVVQLASAPSGTIHGDRVLLEEAIAAVIRNAIEAAAQQSPAPPVEVTVSQVPGERAGRPSSSPIAAPASRPTSAPACSSRSSPTSPATPASAWPAPRRCSARIQARRSRSPIRPAGGLVVTIGLPQHG